jgi:hypothetical protein
MYGRAGRDVAFDSGIFCLLECLPRFLSISLISWNVYALLNDVYGTCIKDQIYKYYFISLSPRSWHMMCQTHTYYIIFTSLLSIY